MRLMGNMQTKQKKQPGVPGCWLEDFYWLTWWAIKWLWQIVAQNLNIAHITMR